MNRYTYRAKRIDNNEWIFGVPYYSEGLWWMLVDDSHSTTETGTGSNNINIETLCQCTGLQDRDGNYIFENDIVINHCHYKALVKFGEYEYLGLKHYGFYIQDIEFNDVFNLWGVGCKIIGNKFDKEED